VVFFMSLLDLYFLSNWLPTVLNDLGASLSQAAAIGSMLQVGGVVGTLALGSVIDRFSFRALALVYFAAVFAVGAIVGPLIGGALLDMKWSAGEVFLAAALAALCAALAAFSLSRLVNGTGEDTSRSEQPFKQASRPSTTARA